MSPIWLTVGIFVVLLLIAFVGDVFLYIESRVIGSLSNATLQICQSPLFSCEQFQAPAVSLHNFVQNIAPLVVYAVIAIVIALVIAIISAYKSDDEK
ncbi:MAG: hypothetical protein QXT13_07585 [Pyrobaculum sp.]